MAVSNALGVNIFERVPGTCGPPWAIQTCFINHEPFPIPVRGLLAAVIDCFVTLIPVALIFQCAGGLPGWYGGLFFLTDVVYLILALGQQLTDCG